MEPRQSGKTTLVKETFKKHLYFSLEDPEILAFITKDPKRFLRENENKYGLIFDEFQHAPQLLSYIQLEADEKDRPGYFVLSRVGQLLNITDIAANCGINRDTAQQWLSILDASYIIYLLKPHFNNFSKRIIKTPKLYFYDTGLACALLGIQSANQLSNSPFRGHLFECFIISDLYKQYYNKGLDASLYFWRDQI